MADALTPDQFLTILRREGVRVAEYPGWRTNERDDETGKPFGPVHMILNHHTVATASLNVVAKGRSDLPGPLAHAHLNKTGLVTLVGAGRANHAGLMAKNAYESFLNELSVHPFPDKSTGTVDGNDVSYGIEIENLGDNDDVYPEAQYDAVVRFNAAIARHYGWSADSVACHKETSVEGKVDPRGPVAGYGVRGRFMFTPTRLRLDVAERLTHGADWSPGQTEEPVPDDGPRYNTTYNNVMRADAVPAPTNAASAKKNPWWTAEKSLQDTGFQLRELHRKVDLILKHLGLDS